MSTVLCMILPPNHQQRLSGNKLILTQKLSFIGRFGHKRELFLSKEGIVSPYMRLFA